MARVPKRGHVREPIQVYLAPDERARLDRVAHQLGVSRAEVLRRGIAAVARDAYLEEPDPLDALVGRFEGADAPTDLALRHDEYLAQALEQEWTPRTKRSSSTRPPGSR